MLERSLSDDEILDLINREANVLSYSQLEGFGNIDEALGPYKALILLYQTTSPQYGHWVCVFRDKRGKINFFDPLGIIPDDENKWIPRSKRVVHYDDDKHLTRLLFNNGESIVYNEVPVQKDKEGINTCGRHVALRLLYRDIPQKKYIRDLKEMAKKSKVPIDHLVSVLTNF